MTMSVSLCEEMEYFVHWHSVFCPADDDIDSKRAAYEAWCHSYTPPLDDNISITPINTGSNIDLRMYKPAQQSSDALPWVLYLHGGMFTYGSLDSHEHIAASLCQHLQAAVICVNYRLAPEAVYPAAEQDCMAALKYLFKQSTALGLDGERAVLMGDDAGASLALALGRQLKNEGLNIRLILALYPLFPTQKDGLSHPILSASKVNQFCDAYMQNNGKSGDLDESQDLSNHPPTILFVPQWDACAKATYQYADQLKKAGNELILLEGKNMVHDCIHALRVSQEVKEQYERMVELIQHHLPTTSENNSATTNSN